MENFEKLTMTEPQSLGDLLAVSPSPHIKRKTNTRSLMLEVIIALIPALAWGIYIFGLRAALVTVVTLASAVAFEWLFQLINKKPVTIRDCSAALTGLLLALNLSSIVPLWVPVVGSFFAIIVVKQIFGGIGKNFLNPALAARVFLFAAWPAFMTKYPDISGVDAVASATPLAHLKNGILPNESVFDLFIGKNSGCIGEISALLLLLGGLYLLIRKVITWHIPVSFLATISVFAFLFPKGNIGGFENVGYQLFTGGIMIAAFFMATDYVTSPITWGGKLIFGAGAGLLVVFIRQFGGYNEGVSFAILIMNSLVWYLDRATKPRVFGKGKGGKSKNV
jgi:electron transport complex protein RnfD